MPTRAELQRVRDLHDRKGRMAQGRFLVQGPKLVEELLRSGMHVEAIYATDEVAKKTGRPDVVVLPQHELDRIGTLESGNTLVAVVRLPEPPPFRTPTGGEVALALDGVTDPGNLGTVIRVADWFGIQQVWCGAGCTDPYGPKAVQASMGSICRVHAGQVELPQAVRDCAKAGIHVFLAEMEGEPLYSATLTRPALVVLGSESHGISAEVRAAGGTALTIPRMGRAESLNVAMAASCICAEFARRTWGAQA
ncbi:MAG: RNA methyltransferase [Flavobacteriales bacterium]|nr:RNA methyltransferase [Flavobacteriales bacterium]